MNRLYYGDNLQVLRESIASESVDLVYLDPPFNSQRNYNLLFSSPQGQKSDAQIVAFEDSWHWGEQAEQEFGEVIHSAHTDAAEMIRALRDFLGENDMMAYLTMMANRLIELHRVLKTTGSLYLHCDPSASHYLKIVLDSIFGKTAFANEIVWQRSDTHNDAKRQFAAVSDRLLFYRKATDQFFEPQYTEYPLKTLQEWYRYLELPSGEIRVMTSAELKTQTIPPGARRFNLDNLASPNPRPNLMYDYKGFPHPPKGWRCDPERMQKLDAANLLVFPKTPTGRIMYKRYLDEQKGVLLGDVWTDVSQLRAHDIEKLPYPTQKPVALLERIIKSSSPPGAVVLDPFCGCGTAIYAAQKLERQWIGIDITHLAISLIEKRLRDSFPKIVFEVAGTPTDYAGARDLALRDKYQFQWWACSLVDAQPYQGKKKGSDGGIDGLIFFQDEKTNAKRVIVSVKGGENVGVTMVKDLVATVQREKAQIGLFVSLVPPTKPMRTEAAAAGFYESPTGVNFPRIQILTIEGLMSGAERPQYPFVNGGGMSFKRGKVEVQSTRQVGMFET